MKHFIRSSVLTVLSFALPPIAAAMNNNDVIKMQKAGLSEETILAAMQKEPAEYDTSVDALITLKGAGVSEAMIQKMIALKSVAAPAPSSAPAQSATAAPVAPPPAANPAPAPAPAPAAGSPAANSPAWSSVLVPAAPSADAPPASTTTTASPAPAPAVSAAFSQMLPSIAPPKVEPVVGQEYFTRFTFHEEKNEHVTTNYARGPIVPINTPVKLVSMSGSQLVLKRSDTGQDVKVKNEEKYTKKPIREIASMMLSAEKTPLEKLPAQLATAISNGEMRKGMTKELVLMARGYPPAHETASTDSDRWVYWSSRFVKHTIVFADGRLAEGRGLF